MSKTSVKTSNSSGISPAVVRRASCSLLLLIALVTSACCVSYQLGNSADKPNSYRYQIGETISYAVQIGNPSNSGENFTVDVYDTFPNGTRISLGRNVSLLPGEEKLYNASYIVQIEDVGDYPRLGAAVNNNVSIEITTEAGDRINTSSSEISLVDSTLASGNASGEVAAAVLSENNSSMGDYADGESIVSDGARRGDLR
jgi:uncharacterized repeat protein (TIGR01451 family)